MTQDELFRAIDGLMAYDVGCTDSGISDPELRAKVESELNAMTDTQKELFEKAYIEECFLSDSAIAQGYGDEDAEEFKEWLLNIFLDGSGSYFPALQRDSIRNWVQMGIQINSNGQ